MSDEKNNLRNLHTDKDVPINSINYTESKKDSFEEALDEFTEGLRKAKEEPITLTSLNRQFEESLEYFEKTIVGLNETLFNLTGLDLNDVEDIYIIVWKSLL